MWARNIPVKWNKKTKDKHCVGFIHNDKPTVNNENTITSLNNENAITNLNNENH